MLLELMLLAKLLGETPDVSKRLVECTTPTSQHWQEVGDHRRALAFVAESKKSVELAEGGPFDCGLALEARCTPDLDGDGAPDVIVRARWEERHAEDGGDESDSAQAARCHARRFVGSSAPYSSLFLVLSGGPSPVLGTVRLLADETAPGEGQRW
jgi:hypothetical protein